MEKALLYVYVITDFSSIYKAKPTIQTILRKKRRRLHLPALYMDRSLRGRGNTGRFCPYPIIHHFPATEKVTPFIQLEKRYPVYVPSFE